MEVNLHLWIRKIIAFVLLSGVGYSAVSGQLQCINYDSQDGLLSDLVTCATEDKDGFMWFGTGAGVCKLMGNRFFNYSILGNGEAPGNIMVQSICTDGNNNIWVGTEKSGLYKFDQSKNYWKHFDQNQPFPSKLKGNEISFVKNFNEGKLWFGGTDAGLGCIDIIRDSVIYYSIAHIPQKSGWKDLVYDIQKDHIKPNKYWLTGHGTFMIFDSETHLIQDLQVLDPEGHSIDIVNFEIVPDGDIYLSSYTSGVFKLPLGQKVATPLNPPVFADDKWRTRITGQDGNSIWATYMNKGIARYDLDEEVWTTYEYSPSEYHGLLPGRLLNMYQSDQGHHWVMTSNGISLIIPSRQLFKYYDQTKSNNFFMDVIHEKTSGDYYMAFAGLNGSFKIFDKDLQPIYKSNTPRYVGRFNSIVSMKKVQNNIFLFSDILYKYENLEIKKVEWPGYSNDLSPLEMHCDQDGSYWILNRQMSLTHYNPKNQKEEVYRFKHFHFNQQLSYIIYDMAVVGNQIWIAAQSELVIMDMKTKSIHYYAYQDDELILRSNLEETLQRRSTFSEIVPIDNNCAWVLTAEEGIFKVCKSSRSEKLIVEAHKDKNDFPQLQTPFSMIEASNDHYWISTNDGLLYADHELTDFKLIRGDHGLKYTKLNYGIKRIEGNLFIGAESGFAVAAESELIKNLTAKNCHILNPKIGDASLISHQKRTVSHKHNTFTATLASPIYDEVSSIVYSYRMNNKKAKEIHLRGATQELRIDNLPSGNYQFETRVKSQNRPWSEKEVINFRIKPPFWMTWWFLLLALLSVVSAIMIIYRNRTRKIKEKSELKAKMLELEKQALFAQMNPHFIFNALNSIRSLILIGRYEESTEYLTQFSGLVRKILQYSNEKNISLKEEIDFLKSYLALEKLRFSVKFDYVFEIDQDVETDDLFIPPLLIQPFVENAIWHGLLHKQDDALLTIALRLKGELIEITIEDNGIGREASRKVRSYKKDRTKREMGVKLGKKRIELIGSEASLNIEDLHNNQKPTGTRVTILLPKINDHA